MGYTYSTTVDDGAVIYSGDSYSQAVGAARHHAWLHHQHTKVDKYARNEAGALTLLRTRWSSWEEGGWRRDAFV